MAFKLKIKTCDCGCGCSCLLKAGDVSGLVSKGISTGYGNSNGILFTSVQQANLFVEFPGGAQNIDVTATYSNVSNYGTEWAITPAQLGLNTYPNGYYTITLTVAGIDLNDEPFTTSTASESFMVCEIEKKIDTLFLTIKPCGCDDCGNGCVDKKKMTAKIYLEAAKTAAKAGNKARALSLLAYLENYVKRNSN